MIGQEIKIWFCDMDLTKLQNCVNSCRKVYQNLILPFFCWGYLRLSIFSAALWSRVESIQRTIGEVQAEEQQEFWQTIYPYLSVHQKLILYRISLGFGLVPMKTQRKNTLITLQSRELVCVNYQIESNQTKLHLLSKENIVSGFIIQRYL